MTGRRRQGLRTLSPDLIDKARDDTAGQISRIGLTFIGTAAFCLLSLLSPDSALLGGSEKINVPGAGPVSFQGFMVLGPLILIVLRVYLQIYVEHSDRLDRLAQRMPVVRAPSLVPLKNLPIRVFSGLTFYLLLPPTILLFAWKAAVFPAWEAGLLCVAAGVIASHAMLPLRRVSWLSRGMLSLGVAVLAGAIFAGGVTPPPRHFELFRADLSGQYLLGYGLRDANLNRANLSDATLGGDLTRANLSFANLKGADLFLTDLSGALLSCTNLSDADLTLAYHVSQAQLDQACGKPRALPEGLKLNKPCLHSLMGCSSSNPREPS